MKKIPRLTEWGVYHKGGDKAAHSVRRAVAQHAPCLHYYLSGLHLLYVCLSTLTFRATSVGGGEKERETETA